MPIITVLHLTIWLGERRNKQVKGYGGCDLSLFKKNYSASLRGMNFVRTRSAKTFIKNWTHIGEIAPMMCPLFIESVFILRKFFEQNVDKTNKV